MKAIGSADSPTGVGMEIRIAKCSVRGNLQLFMKENPYDSAKIKVVFDLDDHTKYFAQSPGGHFGYGHFSSGVPQFFVCLHFALN